MTVTFNVFTVYTILLIFVNLMMKPIQLIIVLICISLGPRYFKQFYLYLLSIYISSLVNDYLTVLNHSSIHAHMVLVDFKDFLNITCNNVLNITY